MTKLILLSILTIAALIYVASPKITFNPFSVTFTNGWFALGIIPVGIGVGMIRYQGYIEGTKTGVDTTFNFINGLIKKENNEGNNI